MEPRRLAIVTAALGLASCAGQSCLAGDLHRLKHGQVFYPYAAQAPVVAQAPAATYYQAPVANYAAAPMVTYAQAPTVMAAPTVFAQAPTVAQAPYMLGAASSASAPTVTTYTITSNGQAQTAGQAPSVGMAPGTSGGRRLLSEFQRRAILQDLRDYKGEDVDSGKSGYIKELLANGREKYLESLNALLGEEDEEVTTLTSEQLRDVEYLTELAYTTSDAPEAITPLSGYSSSPFSSAPSAAAAPMVTYTQTAPAPAYQWAPPIAQQPMFAPQPAPLIHVGNLVPKTKHFHPNQPPIYRFKGF